MTADAPSPGGQALSPLDYEDIKKLAVQALFSVDALFDQLVFKGGNALDLVYDLGGRASKDLDFSLPGELPVEEPQIEEALTTRFSEAGLVVIDFKFEKVGDAPARAHADFWGGYQIEFKVIPMDKQRELGDSKEAWRRNALVVAEGQKRNLRIDISKHEYCEPKGREELGAYFIRVYTPEMIVIEKLRAICQQMPEYLETLGKPGGTARARDFFDIWIASTACSIDIGSPSNLVLVRRIFDAKHVPVGLIARIGETLEYHRTDFQSVIDTVRADFDLKEYDYYFDYVVQSAERLKPLWEEQTPAS